MSAVLSVARFFVVPPPPLRRPIEGADSLMKLRCQRLHGLIEGCRVVLIEGLRAPLHKGERPHFAYQGGRQSGLLKPRTAWFMAY